jgi:hypothetical protein
VDSYHPSPFDSEQQPRARTVVPRPTTNEQVAAGVVIVMCLVLATLLISELLSGKVVLRPLNTFLSVLGMVLCYLQYLTMFRGHPSPARFVGSLLLATSFLTFLIAIALGSEISRAQNLAKFVFGTVILAVLGILQCWCGIQNLRWYLRSQAAHPESRVAGSPWQLSMKEVLAILTILSLVLGAATLLSGTR